MTASTPALAQQDLLPPGQPAPVLRLEAGGPTGRVTSAVFSPEGETLYTAGFDKIVRVWKRTAQSSKFELQPDQTFRIPIGPGLQGAINSLALSPDGNWLAVGGLGIARGTAALGQGGKIWPAAGFFSPEMKQDQGLIYLFHTQNRQVKILRGHTGSVAALAFPTAKNAKPVLISAALWQSDKEKFGEVMAWDVAQGKAVAKPQRLPYPDFRPPGLAVLPGGAGRALIAWGDAKLRLWDLAKPESPMTEAVDGAYNTPLALGSVHTVSASFKSPDGRLAWWNVGGAKPVESQRFPLKWQQFENSNYFYYPRALALCSGTAGGPLDHAAVIVNRQQAIKNNQGQWQIINQHYRLQVFDIRPGGFGQRKADVALWTDITHEPTLTAVAGGKFLAVAGNPSHEVLVYAIADLLQNKKPALQVLRSAGEAPQAVAFSSKSDKNKKLLGLKIGTSGQKSLLFNFGNNALTSDLAGWKDEKPDMGTWAVAVDKSNTSLTVRKGPQQTMHLKWPAGSQVTATALCPQTPVNLPVLAVAVFRPDTAEQMIDIYQAESGIQLRRLTGHLAPIRHLSFSADGKLLASAAEDQTVAVWSMNDLDQIADQHGRLPGFAVQFNEKEQLAVQSFAGIVDHTPAATGLQEGNIITGIVLGNQVMPLTSPAQLYDVFWMKKPGGVVVLQVQDQEGKEKTIEVPARQGIDERQPLFYLFVTRPGSNQPRDWVGWNPTGTYDSSRAEAEKLLGWHFNTGAAAKPASFALLKEYRKQGSTFYRPGILKYLVDQGELADGIREWEKDRPPPQARLGVSTAEGVTHTAGGHVFVRQRQVTFKLSLDGYEPASGDVVEWQKFEAGKWQTWKKHSGSEVSETSLQLPPQPDLHPLRVVVHLPGKYQQPEPLLVTLRYQPPAPELVFRGKDQQTVAKAPFAIQAKVKPGVENQPVQVAVEHQHQGKVVAQAVFTIREETEFDAALKKMNKGIVLKPGDNLIRLMAQNEKPLSGYEGEETVERHFVVALKEPVVVKVDPPVIEIEQIVPLLPGKNGTSALKPGKAVVVDVPKIRIEGKITGQEPLALASWDHGEGTKPAKLHAFKPQKKECLINEEVTLLKPGKQAIRVLAKTPNSPPAFASVTVNYQPQLPGLDITEPDESVVFAKSVNLKANLLPPPSPCPYPFQIKATVSSNNEVVKTLTLPGNARELSVSDVPLQAGNNSIQVKMELAGAEGSKPAHSQLAVNYVVPRVEAIKHTLVKSKPLANLTATVVAPAAPKKDAVKLLVNGQEKPVSITVEAAPAPATWTVQLQQVPLKVGDNAVQLLVGEGESLLKPDEVQINLPPPHLPPPTIDLVSPADTNVTLIEPHLQMTFRVQSETPLQMVQIVRGDDILFEVPAAQLKAMKPDGLGHYLFETKELPLDWGTSVLQVKVRNAGHPAAKQLVVSAVPRPVQIVVSHLEIQKPTPQTIKPLSQYSGDPVFPEVETGKVWLHGTVRWANKDDKQMKQAHWVDVYVNNFRQVPVKLEAIPGNSKEKKFRAELMLNFTSNNLIEAALPDLIAEPGGQLKFSLDCKEPVKGQYLYVVILAPDLPGQPPAVAANYLQDQIMQALKAKRAGNWYQSSVYERIFPVVLPGDIDPVTLVGIFEDQLAEKIRAHAEQGYPNDVVMLYYQGIQTVTPNDIYLWTRETKPGREKTTAVGLSALKKVFAKNLFGAQMMFIDVTPPKQFAGDKQPPAWLHEKLTKDGEVRFAAFGHTWQGKPAPNWAQLLVQLEKQLPRVRDLQALKSELDTWFQAMPAPGYDRLVPPQLKIQFQP